MSDFIEINGRRISRGSSVYVIAEMSGNHNQSFQQAVELVKTAKAVGADAIKLQTYTPETLTIDCDREPFQLPSGNTWAGQNLYQLYSTAYTPWEWQPELKKVADELGLDCFSTPFDHSAVDFLEELDIVAYKIASFELIDTPLVEYIAQQGKPVIMSTGLSVLSEIYPAVRAVRDKGTMLALLKCTSAYPSPPETMNIRTIPHMAEMFGLPVGLSDHSMGDGIAVAAVAQGACIIEKHLTISRDLPGPDSAFSMEPDEFKRMVDNIRLVEKALGEICYEPTGAEKDNRVFRRSLFVVEDMGVGEVFTEENVRSIRPGDGLQPAFLPDIIGRRAAKVLSRGEPLTWDCIAGH